MFVKIFIAFAMLGLLVAGVSFAATDVDHLSLVTTPILVFSNGHCISQGTGFFYAAKLHNKYATFLVTNYHVLTGHSPLSVGKIRGDAIKFFIHCDEQDPAKSKEISLPLFSSHKEPIWLTDINSPEADLAAIPLPLDILQNCRMSAISSEWTKGDIRVRPGSPVTVIGYPLGYYDHINCLPIWKAGNIASEPKVNFQGKPAFMIDIAGFEGMSGSPVFAIAYGTYEMESDEKLINAGTVRKFLGIYTGMWAENGQELVGYVWKADLIDELIKSVDLDKYEARVGDYRKPAPTRSPRLLK